MNHKIALCIFYKGICKINEGHIEIPDKLKESQNKENLGDFLDLDW